MLQKKKKNPRNLSFQSSGGPMSKIKVLIEPCFCWRLWEIIFLYLFQLLVASDILWLVAANLQSLPLSSLSLLSCVSLCPFLYIARSLIGIQYNLILIYVNEDLLFFNFYVFCLFRATPAACWGSQARGWIGAVATGRCQSHSNLGLALRLQPTPQLRAMLDP